MEILKVLLHIPRKNSQEQFGCGVPGTNKLNEHSQPGWRVNCGIPNKRDEVHGNLISHNLIHLLHSEFDSEIETVWRGEEGIKDERLLVWLTFDDLTYPITFSTSHMNEVGIDNYYLGSNLPDVVDITLSERTANDIRWLLTRNRLYGEKMSCYPVFRGRYTSVKRNLDSCFVLMPFTEEWSSRIYNRHLKKAINKTQFECYRADELLGPVPIIEDIWEKICTSGVIVADMTGRNPNVFYELGIAHTVGTPVILISQDHEIPAFDTAHIRQIRYKDNSEACEKLERDLEKSLSFVRENMRFLRHSVG